MGIVKRSYWPPPTIEMQQRRATALGDRIKEDHSVEGCDYIWKCEERGAEIAACRREES